MEECRWNEEGRGEIWKEFQEEEGLVLMNKIIRGCCIMQIMIFFPPL